MKNSLITFFDFGKEENIDFQKYLSYLANGGFKIDSFCAINKNDKNGLLNRIENLVDSCDNIFIVLDNCEFDVKKTIDVLTNTTSFADINAEEVVNRICFNEKEELNNFCFVTEYKEKVIAVVKKDDIVNNLSKTVFPYLEKKYNIKTSRTILKYFGEQSLLMQTLEQAKSLVSKNFGYDITYRNGDSKVVFDFSLLEQSEVREVLRFLITNLQEYIYAESDEELSTRLFDLLKLKKLKMSCAESFTGGRIAFNIIKNSGASEVFNEGIVSYSNYSKNHRLNVVKEDLEKDGAVSSIVAYQMALGLLRAGNCDIAIATTGIAGPKSDDTNKPVGLCYIAVGTFEGIHTYKFNLKGDREEITETAKNTAMFLAIKKLKKM
ncbi:MAG: CinA family protein [Clostridia bacterium]|nr:CinA family protein [Clostridia bacterium]